MKFKHPDSKQSIDVDPDLAEMYESQGWEPADKKSEEKSDGK